MTATPPVTELLERIRTGDAGAVDRLLPMVYDELRGLAGMVFDDRRTPGHTLQPTALVHEAWMKMVGGVDRLNDRRHFFAVAARAMRQVLADHARAAAAAKRGGGARPVTFMDGAVPGSEIELADFHEALAQLERLNPRHARVVELRLLGGLTIEETADMLEVSRGTVDTDWSVARAWLRHELRRD